MVPDDPDRFDLSSLFGLRVLSASGQRVGTIIALIHHGRGCDVLVERRRWLRVRAVRLDLDELVPVGDGRLQHRPPLRPVRLEAGGPGDDAVA
jgi:ribosomal 30S subunit maturation factor RimM